MKSIPPQQKLDQQLCFPLYAAARRIVQWYTPHLQPYGITYPQYLVFLLLWEHQTLTVSQIGEYLQLGSNTLTPLLKRLEKQGWIRRIRSQVDERQVDIHLTSQGEQLQPKLEQLPFQIAQCVIPNSSQTEEIETFRRFLSQILL